MMRLDQIMNLIKIYSILRLNMIQSLDQFNHPKPRKVSSLKIIVDKGLKYKDMKCKSMKVNKQKVKCREVKNKKM